MEQVLEVIKAIFDNMPGIISALGLTVAAASGWVLLTPSPKDDEVVGKIRAFIERISVFFPTEGVKARKTVEELHDDIRAELDE